MSEFIGQPSEDARPCDKGEIIREGQHVKRGLEETGTAPTGDAGTKTGMVPADASECDEAIKQGKN